MRVLIIALLPGGIFEIWFPVFVAIGKLKWMTITAIEMALSAIVIEFILLELHIVEIPMAPAIALLFVFWFRIGIWTPMYGVKILNMTIKDYFNQSLKAPSGACLLMVAVLILFEILFQGHEALWVVKIFMSFFMAGIIFAVTALRQGTIQIIHRITQYVARN